LLGGGLRLGGLLSSQFFTPVRPVGIQSLDHAF
jgi:hypothetical protein